MKHFLYIIFITTCLFYSQIGFTEVNEQEKKYLYLKELGKYEEAIDFLKNWSMSLDNSIMLETNIFRINEILLYPELYQKGLDTLNTISGHEIVKSNPFLLARINTFKNKFLLKMGKIQEAKSIVDSLGFLKFHIIGPYNNNSLDLFKKSYPPEKIFKKDICYRGKIHNIFWFRANIDRTGKINFKNLFSDINNTFFYLYKEIFIKHEDEYFLILGKTGFTDIWLDGKKIFSNHKRHGFHHDQYFLRVYLPAGRHSILVKTGDSNDGIKISMRITDSSGRAERSIAIPEKRKGDIACCGKLISSSLFFSMEKLLNKKSLDSRLLFLKGYLYYISNISKEDIMEALKYFTNINKDDPYYSSACYYIGKLERSIEKKEEFFKKSIGVHKKNIESLTEIIRILLNNKFFHEAYPMIESIKKYNPESEYYPRLQAKLFHMHGWEIEALKVAEKLKKSKYPSIGEIIFAKINMQNGDYNLAEKSLIHLINKDNYNISYFDLLIKCYEKTGKYEMAIKLLHHATTVFSNNVILKIRLSKLIEIKQGVRASIPYLSSGIKLSPYNKKILFNLGMAYHKIDKAGLAKYYMKRASKYDPDNYALKRYIRIINKEQNQIQKYLINQDISTLSEKTDKYKNESAVILLKETAISVNSDGSFEKWIRNIYRINDKTSIEDFKNQYIIIDPSTDTIENLKCIVINNGSRIEISDRFRKSLSDPESRLYYDLEAIIIPIASLRKGSILDISYTIKNRSGNQFKNYFGEKIIIGSVYRTLITNIVLSYPNNKKIYLHSKRVNKNKITFEKNQQKNIYRIISNNCSPYKKEDAMPHYSEILPAVYFTSHKNWNDVYSWYKSLLRNKIIVNKEIKETLSRIISHSDSNIEKVRKIYNHVTKEIRYVGFEFGLGGIQPRSTDRTYKSKMGDCKDISLLLVAMLREAGINARLALIRTRDKGQANVSVPYIGEFNHAICYVNLQKGFFIDGTAEDSNFRKIPADDRNIIALVIDDKTPSKQVDISGHPGYEFINTESKFYEINYDEVTTTVKLLSNGNALLKRNLIKSGSLAPSTSSMLKHSKKKLRTLVEYWNKFFPGSKVSNLKIKSSSLEQPVSYKYHIKIPSFYQIGDKEIIFKSFLIPTNFYKNYTVPKKRLFPLKFSGKWKTKIITKYIIPGEYTLYHFPENEKFIHKKFNAIFKYSISMNMIKIISIINTNVYVINKNEYNEFRKFTRFIDRKEKERIVLVKKNK